MALPLIVFVIRVLTIFQNHSKTVKTELPSGQQVRGIPFGDESSLKVLFKIDKIKEME